jgi:hypothetical protein
MHPFIIALLTSIYVKFKQKSEYHRKLLGDSFILYF